MRGHTSGARRTRPLFGARAARRATAAVTLAAWLIPSTAFAGGLYFSDRGVRPLARGGAYVAGADDLGAIWYNPAGLADAGTSILFDASWLHYTSDFQRQTQVLDSAGTVRVFQSPTVHGTSPVLPIPTLGGSYNFGDKKQFTVAGGIMAPYTAITSYPTTVDGQPAGTRYSLISLDGSALVLAGGWFAFKPIEQIRLGVGLEALVGTFASSVMFNASPPDRVIGPPEDPNYDATAQLNVGPIFSPSSNLGATVIPDKHVAIGMSYQLPFLINAPGKIQVRLPNAVVFDNAAQNGDQVHVRFELPSIFRFGIEVRPIDKLKIEAAYVREFWTTHHSIDVRPDNVTLTGVTGFPSPFKVGAITMVRNFENSNSFRLGGEGTTKILGYDWDLRAGVNYDQSAIPVAYLSPLTIDLDKLTIALGAGLHISEHWRFDAVYAHIFGFSQDVPPDQAAVPHVNPVKGNTTATEAINGGHYEARADVLGVGLNYKF